MAAGDGGPILLYDGVCALCNWMVRFILARDHSGIFRFAPLQGEFAREVLTRHGRNPAALGTVIVVDALGGPGERLLDRSSAVAFVLQRLSRTWRVFGAILKAIPAPLRNLGYDIVAAFRYRTFGKYDACPLPAPEHRPRFLE